MILASDIEHFAAISPVATGYRVELLRRSEICGLVAAIAEWFPDISVGGASCYLEEEFYARKVFFCDADQADHLVLALKRGDEIVGMFSCEIERATQSIYAGLCVASPDHRGSNLAHAGMTFVESLGKHLRMGFIFGMATLKHPYAQLAFERAGWQLVGITPGYDRELVAPGIVKRVYEAMYAKVLEADNGLQHPQRQNLTPRTQEFFDSLFAGCASHALAHPAVSHS